MNRQPQLGKDDMPRMNDSAVTSEADYHAHLEVAEPGGVELVPYMATCNAGNCDNETAVIVKTILQPRGDGVTDDTAAIRREPQWLSICRQHAKEEIDHAVDMLGNVHAVIIHADAIPPEVTEG